MDLRHHSQHRHQSQNLSFEERTIERRNVSPCHPSLEIETASRLLHEHRVDIDLNCQISDRQLWPEWTERKRSPTTTDAVKDLDVIEVDGGMDLLGKFNS